MRQRLTGTLFTLTALILVIAAPTTGAPPAAGMRQQLPTTEASPAATADLGGLIAPYPDGVTLTALAIVPIAETPANPATLRLERYSLAAGEGVAGSTSGPRLIVVESGELTLTGSDLSNGSYGEGAVAMIPPGVAAVISPTDAQVAFLQLRVETVQGSESAPELESAEPPVVLVAGSVRVPRGEATLSVIELEVGSGVDTGQRVFSGPMGLAIESGVLTVVDLDGQATRIEAGSGLIAPAYTAHQVRNDGPDPVRGIAVGVLPTSPGLAGAPVATPTPAQDPVATATFEALIQSQTDLRATVAAQTGIETDLQATIVAQNTTATGAISDAQATTAAVAVNALDLADELATSSAGSFEAEATAASLRTTIVAGEANITAAGARETSLLATSEAMAVAVAAQAGDVAALSTRASGADATAEAAGLAVSGADATIAAQAVAFQTVVATATARALQGQAAESTLAADLDAAEATLVAQETMVAELGSAQGTVAAQASAIAAIEAAPPPAISADYVEVALDSGLAGLVFGGSAARNEVVAEVQQQLQSQIDLECEAGMVLTFGHVPQGDLTSGLNLAGATNNLLSVEMPDVFGDAVTESFVSFEQPFGRATVRVYFTSDCGAATPTPVPTAPTSPPIVPTQ